MTGVVLTPISAIQGNGNVSPLLGEVRAVEGIVTARKSNGFYLQTPDGQDDGDPSTSEGLFVFTTSGGLPAEAQVGNRVQVQGTVAEFTPASAPNQLSLSQLTFATTTLIDTGNPLPAPVPLGLAELSPANDPDFLERYEGMRVAIAELTVVGPSLANINESQAISTGNGVFYGTVPSVPRPLREPGVGVLDVVPFPPGVTPPLYDTNPEVLRVDSRGAGGDAVSVDVGATVTGLVGVLDYAFSAYSLLPDPSAAVTVSGGRAPKPARPSAPDEITVASFNLQRFFDDDAGNNSGSSPTLTPEAFQNRLRKTANALCEFLGIPDIVGVVEVEGIDALTALAEAVNGNLPGTCASDPRYVAYLIEGNDVGGIDVGFLVSTAEVAPGLPRVAVNEVVQEGKDALIDNPNGSTSILNDRPPLRLSATVHGDGSDGFPLTVIANHLRSLGGINDPRSGSNGWPTTGDRIRDKRQKQASFLADLVQARQLADPDERILLVGDFNAFEFSDGYVDVMGIVSGLPAPANEVLNHADSPVSPALLNLTLTKPVEERYSFVFDGSAQTLDHILVNQALLDIAAVDVDHARINADFGGDNFGDFGVPVRTSDHDPVVAYIRLPYVSEADLAAAIARPRLPLMYSGQSQDFRLMMRNNGPGPAQRPSLDVLLDAALEDTALTPPPGWDCVGSEVSERQARYQCLLEGLLDARASATFGLRARAVRHRPVQFFTLTTRVAADSDDPNPRNNGTSLRLRVIGSIRR